MNKNKSDVIVLAAGNSQRFCDKLKKQNKKISNKSLVDIAIRYFISRKEINNIFVAYNKNIPLNTKYKKDITFVAGGKTSAKTITWISDFYNFFDKVPLVLKKEIPGFIATRLQEALWREALHMVANDEATPEQIDLALINGPAPRMAFQGQCMAFHVACGEGGMATNLDQFGPALKLPWTRLKAPELDKTLRDKMVNGCNKMAEGKDFKQMALQRDKAIVSILKAIKGLK